MKKLSNIVCTGAPWLFFWAGKALGLAALGLVAAIASMAIFRRAAGHRMKGPDWAQLLFFGLVLAGLSLAPLAWAVEFQGLLAPALFTAMSLGSLLFGHPFTIKYAAEEVPRSFWNDPGFLPHFLKVNHILTWLWSFVFVLSFACAWLSLKGPALPSWIFHFLPVAAFAAATLLTRAFPLWYQKKYYEPTLPKPGFAPGIAGKSA